MKKVSIGVAESTWEAVQELARVRNIEPDRLLARLLESLKGASPSFPPSAPQRRATLERIWADIDACNVEVGECPSRARTYDHGILSRILPGLH
jgi:Ser/Thr protein kinase RdoA (MazF antagonist)